MEKEKIIDLINELYKTENSEGQRRRMLFFRDLVKKTIMNKKDIEVHIVKDVCYLIIPEGVMRYNKKTKKHIQTLILKLEKGVYAYDLER